MQKRPITTTSGSSTTRTSITNNGPNSSRGPTSPNPLLRPTIINASVIPTAGNSGQRTPTTPTNIPRYVPNKTTAPPPTQKFVPPAKPSGTTSNMYARPQQFSIPTQSQNPQTPKRHNNFPLSDHSSTPVYQSKQSSSKKPLNLVSALSPTQIGQSETLKKPSKPSSTVSSLYPEKKPPVHTNTITPVQNTSSSNSISSSHFVPSKFIIPQKTTTSDSERVKTLEETLKKEREKLYSAEKELESLKKSTEQLKTFESLKEELETYKKDVERLTTMVTNFKVQNPQEKTEETSQKFDTLDDLNSMDDDLIDADFLSALDDDDLLDDKKLSQVDATQVEKDQIVPKSDVTKSDVKPGESSPLTSSNANQNDTINTTENLSAVQKSTPFPSTKSKKRIRWRSKNISDLQKDPDLHKALYKLLTHTEKFQPTSDFIEEFENYALDESDDTRATDDFSLSGRLWKAHRIISSDISKMPLLLPLLKAYLDLTLKVRNDEYEIDPELLSCTLETIYNLTLESEIFRNAVIDSMTVTNDETSKNPLPQKIKELGYCPHPLFNKSNIIMQKNKKALGKLKIQESRKFIHHYIEKVPYLPDYIFDSDADKTISFNYEEVPVPKALFVSKTNLINDLVRDFQIISKHEYIGMVDIRSVETIIDILKTIALWCPEPSLSHFAPLLKDENDADPIKLILSANEISTVMKEKIVELLISLARSQKLLDGSLSYVLKLLIRVSAFLNIESSHTSAEEMIRFRRLIVRLYTFLAFYSPNGVEILTKKMVEKETIIPDAMILLMRKELEYLTSQCDFSSEQERIYLVQDIILVLNRIHSQLQTVDIYSPSLTLDFQYAFDILSTIKRQREQSIETVPYDFDLLGEI